jgi:endonuclease YncB( thermonuclease family)
MLRHAAVAAFLLFAAFAARPSSADVSGAAAVIDGDTIVVAGERVRLQGSTPPSCARRAPPTASNGRADGPRRSG